MKVYVAYLSDRHCDPEIRVFTDAGEAVTAAEAFMHESMAHPEHIEREEVEGYLVYFSYEVGGGDDHAFVVEREVEGAAAQQSDPFEGVKCRPVVVADTPPWADMEQDPNGEWVSLDTARWAIQLAARAQSNQTAPQLSETATPAAPDSATAVTKPK